MPDYVVIHLPRCYECQFGEHRDPQTPHTWGCVEDFQHAEATGQEPPGTCACWCAEPPVKVRAVVVGGDGIDWLRVRRTLARLRNGKE